MSDMKKVGLIFKQDGSADFAKSIRSVNAEIRENYQQMKITQNSWDKSTKASDKLKDKVANLSKAYELNEKKLLVLNEELEELQKNEKATEDQIKSKEAQIKSVEAAMSRYDKNIKAMNQSLQDGTVDLIEFGDKLEKTGKSITDVGKKASVFSAAYAGAMAIAVKKASEWENAWIDVLKVTDGTDDQLDNLSKSIRKMSQELPVSATEIAGVVSAASKLGVSIEDVEGFTETMVKMEIATGISAEQSATAIARFATITNMSMDDVSRLGSVIAQLGDSFATTEQEIIDMSMGLAAAGSQVGMTEPEIMALATALSSVGLEAQAGGSAMSKLMVNMELATKTGEGLNDFAKVANVSGKEFAEIFEQDATKAISMFIQGLSDINDNGGSAIKTLDDMGIKEVRLRDTLLRAANASDTFTDAINVGSKAWEENTKLTEEAELQADTLSNQWQITKNMLDEIAVTFGEIVMPIIKDFVASIQRMLEAINNLSPTMKKIVVIVGAIVAVVGPLLIFIGKIITAVGTLVKVFAILKPTLVAIKAAVVAFSTAIGLPIAVIGALVAAIAGLVYLVIKYWDEIKEFTLNLVESLKEMFSNFIENVKEVFTNIKEYFVELFENIKETIMNIVETAKETIVNVFETVKEFIVNLFETTVEIVSNFINRLLEIFAVPIEFIKNAVLLIIAIFAMMLETIYVNVIKPLVDFFKEGIDTISKFIDDGVAWIVEAFNNTIENIKDFFKKGFEWIKDTVITPFNNFIYNVFTNIKDFINNTLENVKNVFDSAINWIKTVVIQPLVDFFSGVFTSILTVIDTAITKIKNGFQSVSTFVSNVFTAVKDTIVNVFSAIGNIIKAPINGVIRIINNVLKSLNKIKIPDWVPGLGGVGINFPMINYLAKGGNLVGGAAIVGEAGPELLQSNGGRSTVVPLSDGGGAKKREIIDYWKLAQAIRKAFEGSKFILDEEGFVRLTYGILNEVFE